MHTRNTQLSRLVIAALLCAIGIAIPMISPIRIMIPPASYTLGVHVPIFIGMFISPMVAVAVSLGTTLGFFFTAPLVIVVRALSHVVFALVGALMIKRKPDILQKPAAALALSFYLAVIHAVAEVAAVILFFFGDYVASAQGIGYYLGSIFLMVGVGTVAHSMVDFWLALIIWRAIRMR